MTSPSAVVSASLSERVSERAGRQQAAAELPLIVLDEMIAEGLHLQRESRLESAKVLLMAAFRSASARADNTHTDACLS